MSNEYIKKEDVRDKIEYIIKDIIADPSFYCNGYNIDNLIYDLKTYTIQEQTTDDIAYCADCMDALEGLDLKCKNCDGKVAWRYIPIVNNNKKDGD